MKHYCPMCGEQWNDDVCAACGWHEGKPQRYTAPRKRKTRRKTRCMKCFHCQREIDESFAGVGGRSIAGAST